MILMLAKITEIVTQEHGVCFLYDFIIDVKFPQNTGTKAAGFQMLNKDRLAEYTVGEHYTFNIKPFTSPVKEGK